MRADYIEPMKCHGFGGYQATGARNPPSKKKWSEKALIPLPPTGFAFLFCANSGGGANGAPAQARWGGCGVFGNCTLCKVLQRSAAALHKPKASGIGGGFLEATVYKGRAFENRRFAEFSFSESLAPGERLACSRNGINMAESPGVSGFQALKSISPVTNGDTTDSDDLNRT